MVKTKGQNVKSKRTIEVTGIEHLLGQIEDLTNGIAKFSPPVNYVNIPKIPIQNGIGLIPNNYAQTLKRNTFNPENVHLLISGNLKKGAIITIIPNKSSDRDLIAERLLAMQYGTDVRTLLQGDTIIQYLLVKARAILQVSGIIPSGVTDVTELRDIQNGICNIHEVARNQLTATALTENEPGIGLRVRVYTTPNSLKQAQEQLENITFNPHEFYQRPLYLGESGEYIH